jgi:hypothetical protein
MVLGSGMGSEPIWPKYTFAVPTRRGQGFDSPTQRQSQDIEISTPSAQLAEEY